MDFLNSHHEDTVATMKNEKMFVESVFKEENIDGYTYFYWYSIQGEGGLPVEESENYIDYAYKPVDMTLEENLLAPKINEIISLQ